MSQKTTARSIALLLTRRRPLTILLAIIAIQVNPVNGVLGAWSPPHVGQKVGKTVQPALANLYSAFAVTPKPFIGFFVAASPHVAPDKKLRAFSKSMPFASDNQFFYFEATAACAVASAQIAPINSRLSPALAPTEPQVILCRFASVFKDGVPIEFATDKVLESWIGRQIHSYFLGLMRIVLANITTRYLAVNGKTTATNIVALY